MDPTWRFLTPIQKSPTSAEIIMWGRSSYTCTSRLKQTVRHPCNYELYTSPVRHVVRPIHIHTVKSSVTVTSSKTNKMSSKLLVNFIVGLETTAAKHEGAFLQTSIQCFGFFRCLSGLQTLCIHVSVSLTQGSKP